MQRRPARYSGSIVTAVLAAVTLLAFAALSPAMAQHEAYGSHDGQVALSESHGEEVFDETLRHEENMTREVEEGEHVSAAHAEEHGDGGLPQFDVRTFPSQLFWLAVTFAIMYVAFSSRALPAISGTLENRREHIQNDLETADRLRSEAESVQNAYESGLDRARTEATALMSAATEGTKKEGEAALARLREKTEEDMAALEKRIAGQTAEAMEDMNTIAAEVAHEAAEKIFGITTDIKKAKTVVQSINAREAA
jgi:F-type H+-transporting ATPase subunit b